MHEVSLFTRTVSRFTHIGISVHAENIPAHAFRMSIHAAMRSASQFTQICIPIHAAGLVALSPLQTEKAQQELLPGLTQSGRIRLVA